MKIHRVRTKLFLGMGLVICSFIALATLIVTRVLSELAEYEISADLNNSVTAFDKFLDLRFKLLRDKARAISEIPYLKATVGIEGIDHETASVAVSKVLDVVEASHLIICDLEGKVLADGTDARAFGSDLSDFPSVREGLVGKESNGVWNLNRRPILAAASPVVDGAGISGVVIVGEALDSSIAVEIGSITGRNVMILESGKLLATAWLENSRLSVSDEILTVSQEEVARLRLTTEGAADSSRRNLHCTLAGKASLARMIRIPGTDTAVVLSREEEALMAFHDKAFVWLSITGAFTLILGIFVCQLISKRLSRPIQDLIAASRTIADGKFTAPIEEKGDDELSQLTVSFNNMAKRIQQLLDSVREAAAKANAANEAKSEFLANVSHELRTPLTLILGNLEALPTHRNGRRLELEPGMLEGMRRNASRLLVLVNDLLDFAKLEEDEVAVNWNSVRVGETLEWLVDEIQPLVEKKGITLSCTIDETVGSVPTDNRMFEKVSMNLISNALKFTPEGGAIEVRLDGRGDFFELSVADTGGGIPEEMREVIFERFRQVDGSSTRSYGGTGLGLSIVKKYTELLGGSIRLESELGRGSRFIISFPRNADLPEVLESCLAIENDREDLRAAATDAIGGELSSPEPMRLSVQEPLISPVARSESSEQPRVAVIDDSPEMCSFISDLLSAEFETEIFRNGQDALKAVRANPPDVILSDIMMPGMDGFEFVTHLKNDESLKRVPIILLSARTGREAVAIGLDHGADDYVCKPFRRNELLAHVRASYRVGQISRELQEKNDALAEARDELQREMARCQGYAAEIERHRNQLEQMVEERTADLVEAKEAAESSARAKSVFIDSMSHEFRTPLNGITGMVELLLCGDITGEQRDSLNTIKESARVLTQIIDDVLLLSTARSGGLVLNSTEFDLRKLIRRTREVFLPRAAEKRIDLSCGLPPEVPDRICGDSKRVEQVVMKILDNAVKFTDKGGVNVSVERLREADDSVSLRIEVEDTGVGIPAEHLDHVFNSFNQVDSSSTRRCGGCGLGLTVARELVELMGGSLEIESEVGKGTRVRIELTFLKRE